MAKTIEEVTEDLTKEINGLNETIGTLHSLLEDSHSTNKELVKEITKLTSEIIRLREEGIS